MGADVAGADGRHPVAGGDSDETLARRVQEGDRAAMELLVRRYLRAVHTVAASFLNSREEIEDASQETFLRVIGAMERYDPSRPFAPWLYQIARNVARNRSSAISRWRMVDLSPEDTPSSFPGPDEEAERAEIRRRVEAELSRLPDQRQTAFRLVDVEGYPTEEVARLMGVTAGTVRAHVHHARRALRAMLSEGTEGQETSSTGGRS
jgi:RNA polymerase sigma-70 factor, ECF subfamily